MAMHQFQELTASKLKYVTIQNNPKLTLKRHQKHPLRPQFQDQSSAFPQ